MRVCQRMHVEVLPLLSLLGRFARANNTVVPEREEGRYHLPGKCYHLHLPSKCHHLLLTCEVLQLVQCML